ncbi:MAG: hypothetical protein R6W84_02960 [Promethearchaeia archaeon]
MNLNFLIEKKIIDKYLSKFKSLQKSTGSYEKQQKSKFKLINQLIKLLFKYKNFESINKSITNLIFLYLSFYRKNTPPDCFISQDNNNREMEKEQYLDILKKEISGYKLEFT